MIARRGTAIAVGLILIIPLMACLLSLAGIGAAGLIAGTGPPHGWDQLGDAFSVANGIFSVLAVLIVAATLWVQFNELRMQRAELRMQREATERSHRELQRSSEAVFRELHIRLTELAIEDPDLAEVWSRYPPDVSPRRRKQYFFANLMLSHFNVVFRTGQRDEQYFRGLLADQFENAIVCEYWGQVRQFRQALRPAGTPEGDFDALCEEAYQAVLAARRE
ncbi:MAG TPA: DUF6082 family protein [Dactylosporangium sp.]|nr:DUF6082 family protein [Dactylosporangium sp.]